MAPSHHEERLRLEAIVDVASRFEDLVQQNNAQELVNEIVQLEPQDLRRMVLGWVLTEQLRRGEVARTPKPSGQVPDGH